MDNQILTVNHLNVSYQDSGQGIFGKRRQIDVLKDVSFSMKKGDVLGLVGESGCGKTTLAQTLLQLGKRYTGEIICGARYSQMIFQDPYSSLNPSKTIDFILREPLRSGISLSYAEQEKRVDEMLDRVGLSSTFKSRYPRELSGGQRQRICIAEALMLEPEFLIADEPVSALDVTIQAQIMKLLASLHQEMKLSILFISHDLRIVYQICDKVLIMQEGRIVEEGEIQSVYENPRHEYTKTLLRSAGISFEDASS